MWNRPMVHFVEGAVLCQTVCIALNSVIAPSLANDRTVMAQTSDRAVLKLIWLLFVFSPCSTTRSVHIQETLPFIELLTP